MGNDFKYEKELKNAIEFFWQIRFKQERKNIGDQGGRKAVTGGKQLDGMINLLKQICVEVGVPDRYIFTKRNYLPGFFRPTKNWDFLVISPKNRLLICIEIKSQIGPSFGNNFNNRSEEAIGSAHDLWTAYKKEVFPFKQQPWVGYLILVERCERSLKPVRVNEPHFEVMREFIDKSYLDRYRLLCKKMMLERLYTFTSVLWTEKVDKKILYGNMDENLSFEGFSNSLTGYLKGSLNEFKE